MRDIMTDVLNLHFEIASYRREAKSITPNVGGWDINYTLFSFRHALV